MTPSILAREFVREFWDGLSVSLPVAVHAHRVDDEADDVTRATVASRLL